MFGETIDEALARSLKVELGVDFISKKLIGNIEHYPDGPNKHSISMAYVVKASGDPKPADQADEVTFFSEIPENTQPYQAEFIKKHWEEITASALAL